MADEFNSPPRSPIEFRLSIGAEDRESLLRRLRELADRIEGVAPDPMTPKGCWGGAGSHGHYEFDEDLTITPEQYRRDLARWFDSEVRSKRGGADG